MQIFLAGYNTSCFTEVEFRLQEVKFRFCLSRNSAVNSSLGQGCHIFGVQFGVQRVHDGVQKRVHYLDKRIIVILQIPFSQ